MSRHNLKPLSKVIEDLKHNGYEKEFVYKENKLFILDDSQKNYSADDLQIEEEYRFEGDSDPAYMTILYAVKTNDGTKGTISNAYGANADQDLAEFMKNVKETRSE